MDKVEHHEFPVDFSTGGPLTSTRAIDEWFDRKAKERKKSKSE